MISSIHAYSLEWLCQWKTQQLYRPYRPSGTLSWTPLNSLSLYHQYRCFSFESLRCIVFVADLCFLEELLEAPESAQDQLKDLGDGFVWGNYSTLNQHSTIWLFLNYRKSQEVEIWRPLAWNFWRDGVLFICFWNVIMFRFWWWCSWTTRELFQLLDYDGGGTVGVEEFCEGVLKAGEVRATRILQFSSGQLLIHWPTKINLFSANLASCCCCCCCRSCCCTTNQGMDISF